MAKTRKKDNFLNRGLSKVEILTIEKKNYKNLSNEKKFLNEENRNNNTKKIIHKNILKKKKKRIIKKILIKFIIKIELELLKVLVKI